MAGNRDFEITLKMRAEFAQAQAELKRAQANLDQIGGRLGTINKLGSTTRGIFTAVGVAATAIGVAAVAGLKAYIENTIEAEKVQAQLASRIADTAGAAGRSLAELNVQSKKLEGLTIFDDEAIGNAQAMLLTFKQIQGVEFDKATAAALDLATVTGQELPEAARQLGKALNDPIGGLAGLSKAGIQFTDDEKKVIKAMVESGNTAGAQELILKSLESRMGTAAEAARNTLGGALQALKNSFHDLLEGDTSKDGLKGARVELETLITTLNDPNIKRGVDSTANGLIEIANAAVKVIAQLGNAGSAIAEFFADNDKKSLISLQNKRTELETSVFVMERNQKSALRRISAAIDSPFMGSLDENLAKAKAEIAEIDKLIAARQRAAAAAPAVTPASGATGTGTGTPPPPPATPTGASKADPDAAGKARLASLREEAALLDKIKDGETQASDAEKLRYDLTEGALKNISPALKQQLLDTQAIIDKKRGDIDAEKARKQAFEETQQAYESLRDELRTPAEIALDNAIAKVNTLNAALKAGLVTKAEYEKEAGRIADGSLTHPAQGQSSIGGAGDALAQIEQERVAENQRYADALKALETYRIQHAELNAKWDAEEERQTAEHQAKLRALEAAQTQVMLGAASAAFGQLADIAKNYGGEQSKIYRVLFAISKAFAIAQAAVSLATNIAKASEIGFPYNIPFIAGAIAQGAEIASLIAQATYGGGGGGYAEGGYTGPGGKYQPAGIVHAGEGVLNQGEIAALGGPGGFYALRDAIDDGSIRERLYGWAGYADGGLVTPAAPQLASPDFASFPQGGAGLQGAQVNNAMRVYLSMNQDALIEQLASHPKFEKKVVAIAGENGKAITANW